MTSLKLAGYGHYLDLAGEAVQLFGRPGLRLPRWFTGQAWGVAVSYSATSLFVQADAADFVAYQPQPTFVIRTSCPERAVLEWLHVLPDALLFGDTVVDTFAGLGNLRPSPLQSLLQRCGSVRVKRAFLVLARHAGHAWYHRLDASLLQLGQGKRQLWPGGKLDREFLITVPEALARAS